MYWQMYSIYIVCTARTEHNFNIWDLGPAGTNKLLTHEFSNSNFNSKVQKFISKSIEWSQCKWVHSFAYYAIIYDARFLEWHDQVEHNRVLSQVLKAVEVLLLFWSTRFVQALLFAREKNPNCSHWVARIVYRRLTWRTPFAVRATECTMDIKVGDKVSVSPVSFSALSGTIFEQNLYQFRSCC